MMLPADEVLPDVLPVAAPSNPPNTPAIVEPVEDEELLAAADAVVAAVDVADVLVEAAVVVVFLVDVFFLEEVFLVVFFTGIISDCETLCAASFIVLAMLPDVHAITRAAIKNTFFIPIYILIHFCFRGAKFAKKMEIRKEFPLFLLSFSLK